jgi:endo-1,4-beta-xylanase
MKIQLAALLALSIIPAFSQQAFQPKPIMPGGEIVPLYPPDSPFLDKTRISEPEKYNTTFKKKKPDHIVNVLNIHNPSIEVHLAPDNAKNTGAAIIIAPGGGHRILWVAPEGAKWVPHLFKVFNQRALEPHLNIMP